MSFKKIQIPGALSSLPAKSSFSASAASHFWLRRRNAIMAIVLLVVSLFVLVVTALVAVAQVSGWVSLSKLTSLVVMPFTRGYALPDDVKKVNVLLVGMGGGAHDGAELTDTIMLASANVAEKTVSMLSIPRDLYIEYPTGGRGKINEVYMRSLARGQTQTQALHALGDMVRTITGQDIQYVAAVDFAGFVQFVDTLGWVTLEVPEDLVDNRYPDYNWGYTTFSIKKGTQTLDGETALKYARSRHSTNDFSRSARQQAVISALRDRLLSMDVLTSPTKLNSLYLAIKNHIITDIPLDVGFSLAAWAQDLPHDSLLSFTLNDSCYQGDAYCDRGGYLYTPLRDLFGGASVLLPRGATPSRLDEYAEIRRFATLAFDYPQLYREKIPVYLVNTTKKPGLALTVALALKRAGFNVPDQWSIFTDRSSPANKTSLRFALGSIAAANTGGVTMGSGATNAQPQDQTDAIATHTPETLDALSLFMLSAPVSQVDTLPVAHKPFGIEIILGTDAQTAISGF